MWRVSLVSPSSPHGADEALAVHLSKAEQEHGPALLVLVVPTPGKVLLNDSSGLSSNSVIKEGPSEVI